MTTNTVTHWTRRRVASFALAGIFASVGGFAIASHPASAAGPTYQVVNTGGVGVRLRNSPSINDIKGPGPKEGASFELLCQTLGDPVGSYSNRVWDRIRWADQVGFIPDTYTNTPTVANQFVAGVPRCDESAPATPAQAVPAVAGNTLQPGQTLSSGQSIRSTDGRFQFIMQPDGNMVLYQQGVRALWSSNTLGVLGARVLMQGDGTLVVYDNTNRARWSSNTAGRAGARLVVQDDGNTVMYTGSVAIWSTRTGVGSAAAASTSADRAARWAEARIGNSNPGADNPNDPTRWSGWCLGFAAQAWRLGSGVSIPSYYSAQTAFNTLSGQGRIGQGTPPRGAIVFYSYGSDGHAGVSIGNGQVVSTQGVSSQDLPVRQHGYNSIGLTYLGYWLPA